MLRPLTFICAYYENPGMLQIHLRTWRNYPPDLRAAFHAIVTDDGSPTRPALPVLEAPALASFQLYRTLEDRRWNWLFCRNLGHANARTEWLLFTDIDHVLESETARMLMTRPLDPNNVYRLSRVDAPDHTPYKPHPNTWLMTGAMFENIGGYDERFSGYYGSDSEFRERVEAKARQVVRLEEALVRYPRDIQSDASTTTYGRKEEQDRIAVPRIRAERDLVPNWRPLRVTFPYERLVVLGPADGWPKVGAVE